MRKRWDSGVSLVPVISDMAEWLFMGAVLALPTYIIADARSIKELCELEVSREVSRLLLLSPATGPPPRPGAQINYLVRGSLLDAPNLFAKAH